MSTFRLLAAATLALSATVHAQTGNDHSAHHQVAASGASAATVMTDGEVRKIDKAQGKVTLKHGPIANLEMPPMTMVFKVTDPKMLDRLKNGDKVRFRAGKVDGAMTVTAIEPAAQ